MDSFEHTGNISVRDNFITGRREVLYGDKVVEFYSAEMVGIINKQFPGIQPPFGFFIEVTDGNK